MKKLYVMLLVLIMVLSLAACGGNESTNSESSESQEAVNEDPLIGTWVGLYNGTILTFNKDNSFSKSTSNGTWAKDNSSVTVKYTTSGGNNLEEIFDIIEEGDSFVLRNRAAGKYDGESVNFQVYDYYPENNIQKKKQSVAKKTGDMVSSDIMEFTVNKAELAWYAQSPQYDSSTKKVSNIDSACAPTGEDGFFKANKGHTLICLDFTIKNTDRGTLNTLDNIISFTVIQNGKSGTVNGYDLNYADGKYGMDLSFSPIAENGGDFYKNETSNELINAGSTLRIKMVGIVSFDADLKAPFDLGVSINNSSNGTDKFLYTIE